MSNPQELDHAAFARVWRRVMPQDRPDCPIELNSPTAQQETPAPEPPIGAINALAMQTMPAPLPQPVPSEQPNLCLGECSVGALPTLSSLIELAREGRQIYTALARPNRGRTTPYRRFALAKEQQLRRLRTAYFLIAGTEPEPTPLSVPHAPSLALTLRGRYHAEQNFALACLTAIAHTSDPCLTELYRSLANQSQALAGEIRELLEDM